MCSNEHRGSPMIRGEGVRKESKEEEKEGPERGNKRG